MNATCPWCGVEERNDLLLGINHAADTYMARRDRECAAMNLTRNHVVAFARNLATRTYFHSCCERHKTFGEDCARERLRRAIDRACEVWPDTSWLPGALASEGVTPDLEVAALTEPELVHEYVWCASPGCLHLAFRTTSIFCPIHWDYPFHMSTTQTVPTGSASGITTLGDA